MNSVSDNELPAESSEELYEHAPCGYISTRPGGAIARVNETFLNWTGYDRSDLLSGTNFQNLLNVGGRIFYETQFAPLLRMQGHVSEIAFDLRCKDGQHLPVFVSAIQSARHIRRAAL